MLKILVIEDNPKHLKDAEKFFASRKDVEAQFAINYREAARVLYGHEEGFLYTLDGAEYLNEPLLEARLVGVKRNSEFDGVITDIFFPLQPLKESNGLSPELKKYYKKRYAEMAKPRPLGVRIAIELDKLDIPFVFVTSLFHHGSDLQWICELQRELDWPEMIDYYDRDSRGEREADSKDWQKALKALRDEIEARRKKSRS